jgi:hypothetical protein
MSDPIPALVYNNPADASADVAAIDAALGFPNAGADTWYIPEQRWDGMWWIIDPVYDGHPVAGLVGTPDPDVNAWPPVP